VVLERRIADRLPRAPEPTFDDGTYGGLRGRLRGLANDALRGLSEDVADHVLGTRAKRVGRSGQYAERPHALADASKHAALLHRLRGPRESMASDSERAPRLRPFGHGSRSAGEKQRGNRARELPASAQPGMRLLLLGQVLADMIGRLVSRKKACSSHRQRIRQTHRETARAALAKCRERPTDATVLLIELLGARLVLGEHLPAALLDCAKVLWLGLEHLALLVTYGDGLALAHPVLSGGECVGYLLLGHLDGLARLVVHRGHR
jgi:hypothetical protein